MIRALPLALAYLAAHPLGALIRVACVAITAALPLTVTVLVSHYEDHLVARAASSPLVLGAPGSRHDLVMTSLYFRPTAVPPIRQGDALAVMETGRALAIPLHTRFTADGHPLVGTTPDYFSFRGLKPATGRLPGRIGEAVLGASVPVSDAIRSDQRSLYNLAATYPLKMQVVGTLAPTGTPDDEAVFVDVKTAWIIEGLAHGHQDVTGAAAPGADAVEADPALVEYQEITEANLHTFHMHGDPEGFPLTAALVVPRSERDRVILCAALKRLDGAQVVEPAEVIAELMSVVFKIKGFLDIHSALVAGATLLLLALVVALGLRLRRDEMRTLTLMGASKGSIFWINAWEWLCVLGAGLGLAALATLAALRWAPALIGL